MITCNEGNVGSGKSYDAVVEHILKELKNKRQVFARIDGLNYQMFADLLQIELEELQGKVIEEEVDILERKNYKTLIQKENKYYAKVYQGLLFEIEEDQILKVYDHVATDSFVVIDEIQDYWPMKTKPLDSDISRFVTRHRHEGIDLLILTQDHRDIHSLWKRRINILFRFTQLDALGKSNRFNWNSSKQFDGKFTKVSSGSGKYDSKYFGLYKSHSDATTKTDTTINSRANIFRSPLFKFVLPGMAIVTIFALYYLISFFTVPDEKLKKKIPFGKSMSSKPVYIQPQITKAVIQEFSTSPTVIEEEIEEIIVPQDYINNLLTHYRPRLTGLVQFGDTLIAVINIYDESNRMIDTLTIDELNSTGWKIKRSGSALTVTKNDYIHYIKSWPFDIRGRVPQKVNQALTGS